MKRQDFTVVHAEPIEAGRIDIHGVFIIMRRARTTHKYQCKVPPTTKSFHDYSIHQAITDGQIRNVGTQSLCGLGLGFRME